MGRFVAAGLALALGGAAAQAATPVFLPGNLVVSVEGNGVWGAASGSYTTNQAAPLTMMQFSHVGTATASYVGSLVLPQTGAGAISGEYRSSSEGFLQQSGDGRYLTVMGYGVNAADFNANPTAYGTLTTDPSKSAALGQSGSLAGQGYTPVARVVALIDGNGNVDTSTRIGGIFNGNNPRSAYTIDGSSFYVSGQGQSGDTTGGVYYAARGAATATAITGKDTSGKTANQDTRDVQVYNGQLYVSADSKQGSGAARSFVGTLGAKDALPTSLANNGDGPAQLAGTGTSTGKLTMTAATGNGLNTGLEINLSPEQYFFADANTLYIADAGLSKQTSAASKVGDGGLQKWVLANGSWSLAYTLSAGLNLVAATATSGTSGLYGLAGTVSGDAVQLFATNYTLGDSDQTYLYGITDSLSARTKAAGATFAQLAAAPVDSTFRGVAFAPTATTDVPEPGSWMLMTVGFGLIGGMTRRTRRIETVA